MPYTANDEETLPMNYQAKAQHTPGPWRAGSNKDHTDAEMIYHEGTKSKPHGGLLAKCTGDDIWQMHENARLIAAAPELLEALQGMVRDFAYVAEQWSEHDRRALKAARAAIAKATGQV